MWIIEQLRARKTACKAKELMTLLNYPKAIFTEKSSTVSFVPCGSGVHFVSIQRTLSSGTNAA
jgi:hypothetical protein